MLGTSRKAGQDEHPAVTPCIFGNVVPSACKLCFSRSCHPEGSGNDIHLVWLSIRHRVLLQVPVVSETSA